MRESRGDSTGEMDRDIRALLKVFVPPMLCGCGKLKVIEMFLGKRVSARDAGFFHCVENIYI